ncbi:MAG: hypothetical protein EZS28_018292, partial [Streblomastix strix]
KILTGTLDELMEHMILVTDHEQRKNLSPLTRRRGRKAKSGNDLDEDRERNFTGGALGFDPRLFLNINEEVKANSLYATKVVQLMRLLQGGADYQTLEIPLYIIMSQSPRIVTHSQIPLQPLQTGQGLAATERSFGINETDRSFQIQGALIIGNSIIPQNVPKFNLNNSSIVNLLSFKGFSNPFYSNSKNEGSSSSQSLSTYKLTSMNKLGETGRSLNGQIAMLPGGKHDFRISHKFIIPVLLYNDIKHYDDTQDRFELTLDELFEEQSYTHQIEENYVTKQKKRNVNGNSLAIYLSAARNLMRLELMARSLVLSLYNKMTSSAGLSIIRSYGMQLHWRKKFANLNSLTETLRTTAQGQLGDLESDINGSISSATTNVFDGLRNDLTSTLKTTSKQTTGKVISDVTGDLKLASYDVKGELVSELTDTLKSAASDAQGDLSGVTGTLNSSTDKAVSGFKTDLAFPLNTVVNKTINELQPTHSKTVNGAIEQPIGALKGQISGVLNTTTEETVVQLSKSIDEQLTKVTDTVKNNLTGSLGVALNEVTTNIVYQLANGLTDSINTSADKVVDGIVSNVTAPLNQATSKAVDTLKVDVFGSLTSTIDKAVGVISSGSDNISVTTDKVIIHDVSQIQFQFPFDTGQNSAPIELQIGQEKKELQKKQQIFVINDKGRTSILDIDERDSVENVKQKIEDKTGIPSAEQRLILSGKQLEDGHTLFDYAFKPGSTVQVVLSLNGGGKKNYKWIKKKNKQEESKINLNQKYIRNVVNNDQEENGTEEYITPTLLQRAFLVKGEKEKDPEERMGSSSSFSSPSSSFPFQTSSSSFPSSTSSSSFPSSTSSSSFPSSTSSSSFPSSTSTSYSSKTKEKKRHQKRLTNILNKFQERRVDHQSQTINKNKDQQKLSSD